MTIFEDTLATLRDIQGAELGDLVNEMNVETVNDLIHELQVIRDLKTDD